LENLRDDLELANANWEEAIASSQGLSAALAVETPNQTAPEVTELRNISRAMVVGGILGFLCWLIVVLVQITRRGNIKFEQ
jgi:hypothetical protein